MPLIYEPSLVFLSVVIAIQGSYVALRIALQISGSHGQTRRLLLAGAAYSLAVGIWGMHFIGMLAAHLPVSVNYLVLPTLLSFLICVLVVGVAIEAVSLWPRTYFTLFAAPIAMGSGIVAMHYTGMWATAPEHLVDLAGINGLKGIRQDQDQIAVGAMTTQSELIASPLLADTLPIIRETSLLIGDPQIRYLGTIGGNVANGDPGNDMPALMMCLDAEYQLAGPNGQRRVRAGILSRRL